MAKLTAYEKYLDDNRVARDKNIKAGKEIAPEILERFKQLGKIGKVGTPMDDFKDKLQEERNISPEQIKIYCSTSTATAKYYFSYKVQEIESSGKGDLIMEVVFKKQETTTSDPEVKTMMMAWSNPATIQGVLFELDVFFASATEILVDFKPSEFLNDFIYFLVNEKSLMVPLNSVKLDDIEGLTAEQVIEAKQKRIVEAAYNQASMTNDAMVVGKKPFKQIKDSIKADATAKKKRAYDSALVRLTQQTARDNRDKQDHQKLKEAQTVESFYSSTKSAWKGVVNAVTEKIKPSSDKTVEGKFGGDDD